MRRLLVVLFVVLSPSLWAQGLTAKERESVSFALQAADKIAGAESDHLSTIAKLAPINGRPQVTDLTTSIVRPARDLTYLITHLIGGIPLFDLTKWDDFEAQSREDRVKLAWFHLNRIKDRFVGLPVAKAKAEAIRGLSTDPEYQSAITSLLLRFEEAEALLVKVDTTLPYATPSLAETLVGPHGNEKIFKHRTWRSISYWQDSFESFAVSAYSRSGNRFRTDAYAEAIKAYGRGIRWTHRALGLAGGVQYDPTDVTPDRFCQVLRAMDLLTSADDPSGGFAPEAFQVYLTSLLQALDLDPDVVWSVDRGEDAWKNQNWGTWTGGLTFRFALPGRCAP